MKWNIENIRFLHQPDFFLGTFDNPHMQARHERELENHLNAIKEAVAVEEDPLQALKKLNVKDQLQFLRNNLEEFVTHRRLEEALLLLYTRNNAPFSSGGDAALWEHLFKQCDAALLQRTGNPFPHASLTVYRGSVSGFMRSLAWTPERRRAQKFAERWRDPALGGGAVYEVDIVREDVLVYLHGRTEEVVVLSPDFIKNAEIRPFSG